MGAFSINATSEIRVDDQYFTIRRIAHRVRASSIWELITRVVQTASEQLGNGPAEEVGIAHVPLARVKEKVAGMPQGSPHWQESVEQVV